MPPYLKPPANLRAGFEKIVSPLFEIISTTVYQIRTLEKLRNALLLKLMSGKVCSRL